HRDCALPAPRAGARLHCVRAGGHSAVVIPVTLLDVHIRACPPLDLGANPGSSLRGALFEALRTMYDTGGRRPMRHDADANPVAWLLALEDEEVSGGKDVPRPIALRPPLGEASTTMTFGLAFYGSGHSQIPMVLTALPAMGTIGIGRGRRAFELVGVDQLDPLTLTRSPLLDEHGQMVAALQAPPDPDSYQQVARRLEGRYLTVDFLTPTRIIEQKRLCHTPRFRPWFQRLLERTRLISEVYMETPVWLPFKELLTLADAIEIVEDVTHWQEMWSGSRRSGQMMPTSGFKGRVTYTGPFQALLPWLLLGQSLQVGKNTVKGCGWYRLTVAG